MGGSADSLELDQLLAHASWVRRVATALVRDPGAADDLAQEVWLRALEKRPEGLVNPRAWLASVARSLAATGARGRVRRRRREESAARREGLPAADEVLAEAEREREVAALVLALEEPYRSVVLLRYYRDLPPRRIAEELGRPVATVKVQLQRGLARLRTQLDRRHGGRETWGALLLPLCVARAPVAATAAASLVLLSLLATLALWWRAGATPPGPAERAVASVAEPVAAPPASASGLAMPEPSRARSAADPGAGADLRAAPETAAVASERRLETLHARLVTPTGEPLVGVRVAAPDSRQLRWASAGSDTLVADDFWLPLADGQRAELARSAEAREAFVATHFLAGGPLAREALTLLAGGRLPPPEAWTDARGLFRLEVRPGSRGLELLAPELALVGSGPPAEPIAAESMWFLAAPALRLEGRVLDALGRPCAGALVEHAAYGSPAHAGLIRSGATLQPVRRTTQSDEGGRFAFERLPGLAGGWLSATKDGEGTGRGLDLSGGVPPAELTLVLALLSEELRPRVLGTVLRPDGQPASEARVILAGSVAKTDETGAFELVPARALAVEDLYVIEPGYDPLHVPAFVAGPAGSGTWSAGVLHLPATRLALSGSVTDAAGNPLSIAIELLDATRLDGLDPWLEHAASGTLFQSPSSASDGTFELRGLLDREYRLRVDGTEFGPFRAGTRDLRLVVER